MYTIFADTVTGVLSKFGDDLLLVVSEKRSEPLSLKDVEINIYPMLSRAWLLDLLISHYHIHHTALMNYIE